MNNKAINSLAQLAMEDFKKKYPNVPGHAVPVPKYSPKTANGLSKMIVDYIGFIGGIAERRSNTGRRIDNTKIVSDIMGRKRTIGSLKWIPGTGRNGTSDLSGVFKSTPLAIEIKIGKDKQSLAQKKYQKDFENAGGWYYIARSFDDFYKDFNKKFNGINETDLFTSKTDMKWEN